LVRSVRPGVSMLGSTGTTVLLLVAVLVALGVAMIALAVWLVRTTRSDPPALGPLEAMGGRPFRRADDDDRTTRLAAARPDGAPPPAPILPLDDEAQPDAELDAEPRATPDASATEIGEPDAPEAAPTAHRSQVEEAR
ncbi:MAG: hypothetical protein ACRD0H_04325, partial [Actinomycetes bacterium]